METQRTADEIAHLRRRLTALEDYVQTMANTVYRVLELIENIERRECAAKMIKSVTLKIGPKHKGGA